MQENPLENNEILVSNIELKEITKKDGGTFKQFNVIVPNEKKGIFYTLPIKKKDGSFTKVYEIYKANKSKLDESFAEGNNVKIKIAYSENVAEKEFEGVKRIFRYRTIRFMEILVGEGEQPSMEIPSPEEDIALIPF